jgi:uncharacterized protein (TIGR02099 family)
VKITFSYILKKIWHLLTAVIILVVLLICIANLLSPILNKHRADFEKFASELLQSPVSIREVAVSWRGLRPEISLANVIILDAETKKPKLVIEKLAIDFNILKSIFTHKLSIQNMILTGANLTILEKQTGQFQIGNVFAFNIQDKLTGESLQTKQLFEWIFSQPHLGLEKIRIQYIPIAERKRSITLKKLSLSNTDKHHVVDGIAILNQEVALKADIHLAWDGDVRQLPDSNGHVYLNFSSLSLPQWFGRMTWREFQVVQGLGNIKVWLRWNKNEIYNVQSKFEMDGIELYSDLQKQNEIVNRLVGEVSWNGKQANLNINGHQLTLMLNQYFTKPLYFENILATLQLNRDTNGTWSLRSNNLHLDNVDATANMKIMLTVPATDSPLIDLTADFSVVKVVNIARYLPLKLFEPALATWLHEAFLSGSISAGKVIINGQLKDFPFATPPGKFYVGTKLNNVEFNYAPHWPHLQDLNGELVFSGDTMTVEVKSGRILDVPLANLHGTIPYLGPAAPQIVKVDGLIQSDLDQGLSFIRQSPLQKTLGKKLAALQLTGPMLLKLSLSVPLRNPETSVVLGDVDFSKAVLRLPEWNLALENLQGKFQFTDKGLEAKNIQGRIFNTPATLHITTLRDGVHNSLIRADLMSAVSIPVLSDWLKTNLSSVVKGGANYTAQLYLSAQTDSKSPADYMLVNTDLQGIAVDLPSPYGKSLDVKKDFQLRINLEKNKYLQIKLRYAQQLSAALSLLRSTHGLQIFGGELSLSPDANWQSGPGIVVTGNVPELNISVWKKYFSDLSSANKSNSSPDLKKLKNINLRAQVVDVMNMQLHQCRIQAVPTNTKWQININSTEMDGDLSIPYTLSRQSVVAANLRRLTIMSSNGKKSTEEKLDPKTLPALTLNVDDMRYQDMRFGHVRINLQPSYSGLVIQQLQIAEPALKLNASGSWTQIGGRNQTHLQGDLSTPSITNLLTQLGESSASLVGGAGNIKFDLNWPGVPHQPTLATLSGSLAVKLDKGTVTHLSDTTNTKIGLGRLLNILSLSSMPQYLSLDFSHLSQQGYNFDGMSGDFTFRNGNAYTDNMRFNGPEAKVSIKGRMGLQAKDLDIQLGVNAHVTGSLPLVATLAGGPIAGVATWMVDKVVSQGMSQGVSYQYKVTGSWANPQWQKLGK